MAKNNNINATNSTTYVVGVGAFVIGLSQIFSFFS